MMNYPNAAMVISSDLGGGLHPLNKSGYGRRACDVALGMVYGKKIEYYGPKYATHTIDDGKVTVTYTHVGQGLAFKHADRIQGFALAGEDRTFQWADATFAGDTVIVSSAKVPKPLYVRYAWSLDRSWANLFNKDGLPAIPFRTDDDVPRTKAKK
jgi:sialate O-acetylesterase